MSWEDVSKALQLQTRIPRGKDACSTRYAKLVKAHKDNTLIKEHMAGATAAQLK